MNAANLFRKIADKKSGFFFYFFSDKLMGKKIRAFIMAALFILFNISVVLALPEGWQVETGEVNFESPDSASLNITASDKSVINFNTFNIAQNEIVNFIQPFPEATVLSRVVGGQPSQILGALNANGVLILSNPQGINLTPTAQVQVNTLILSTLDISTNNFVNENYVFEHTQGAPYSQIVNSGTIKASNIAIIAGAVSNTGIIYAKAGTVHLASGDKTTVAIDNKGFIHIEINEETSGKVVDLNGVSVKDAIANSGTIEATQVIMNAQTASDIFENAVNQTGIVKAAQMVEEGGVIRIVSNQRIQASGTLEAKGGSVEILSEDSVVVDAALETTGDTKIAANKDISINADLTTNSGNLELIADNDLNGEGAFKQAQDTIVSTVISGDITIQSSGESSLANISSSGNLTLRQGGVPALFNQWPGSHITTAASLKIEPNVTLNPADSLYEIGKDWLSYGNFNPDTSTVSLVSAQSAQVVGSNNFYNFSIKEPGKIVAFDSDKTQTIMGALTLRGDYGNLLVLTAIAAPAQWKIFPQGTTDIAYVLAGNSMCVRGPPESGAQEIYLDNPANRGPPLKGVHSDSLGNLTNWNLDPYWVGAGADNNWSTAANWDTGTVPISTSDITFDGTDHGVPGAVPNKDSTIDASFQGTINSLTINGYTGIITQARALTITGAYSQATGAFTGASQAITVGGNWTLSSGTFTSTSGMLSVSGNWLHTAGTFTHNSGTVDFNGSGTQDLCYGSDAFYNLTHSGTGTLYVWPYRKAVTIDRTKVSSAQTDFPVLLYINGDIDLYAKAQSDGDDLVFIGADGTRLAHEIEYYSRGGSSDTAYVWVKIPALLSSDDTVFYMNYGNATCSSQQNAAGVWSSSYAGVWHLPNGTTLGALDSTSNDNDGTIYGATAGAGKIDGAGSFDGVDGYIDCGNRESLDLTTAVTISVWINPSLRLSGQNYQKIIGKFIPLGVDPWELVAMDEIYTNNNRVARFIISDGSKYGEGGWKAVVTNTVIDDGFWWNIVGTWDSSSQLIKIYVNGNLDNTTETSFSSIGTNDEPFLMGRFTNDQTGTHVGGLIDEARISSTARSADWIATEYANQNSPATFSSIGSQSANTLTIANNLTQSGSGTMNAADASLAIGGNISVPNGTLNASNANCNLDVAGNVTVVAGTLSAPAAADDASFTVAGSWEVSGTGIFTPNAGRVLFDAGTTGKTIVTTSSGADDFYDIKFNNAAGGWTASDSLETTNFSLTAGTFVAPATTLTVSGNWTHTDGIFTHNSGTVVFNGTETSAISGNDTFYNLTCAAAGKTLNFAAGSAQTITGDLTLTGAAGKLINLRSSSSPVQWMIDPQGARIVSYVDVEDSNNINAKVIDPANYINSGNNTNWFRPDPVPPEAISNNSILQSSPSFRVGESVLFRDPFLSQPLFEIMSLSNATSSIVLTVYSPAAGKRLNPAMPRMKIREIPSLITKETGSRKILYNGITHLFYLRP